MGIYKFKPEDAERFARHVGIRTRHRGEQLEFITCPYCKTTEKWKFSISMKTGQFQCWRASCGAKGNMIRLSREFNFSLGREVDAYYSTADYSSKQYRDFKEKHTHIEVRTPAIEYLASRGISEITCRKYEITTGKYNDHILVFPFRDEKGQLTAIKYRKTNYNKEVDDRKEWFEAGCKPILFGMNHCDPEDKTLILTEGQIDALSVAEAGYNNVVSVPNGVRGFTWVPYCYDFMSKFQTIIVMGDCEHGKITLADDIGQRWPDATRICRMEDYQGCKDANEILQKFGCAAIRNAIENAQASADKYIKPIKDVEKVDIMKMEWFSTGIKSLDDVLDGGFRFGQLAVMTGQRGDGKSTLASMIGVFALEQHHKAFFYSGELTDFFFRNWMDCQITGKKELTDADYDQLNAYYGDNAYLYDSNLVQDDDEEIETLPETIKNSVVKYGCRFIMIDNLMTALSDDLQSDLYRAQSKFVGALAALAKKYNVFILLICHPRKLKKGEEIDNDDISGSSNITDRADITMTLSRIQDDAPDARKLCVKKNRLTGKCTNEDGIRLIYDADSRRLAETTKDLFHVHFSWYRDDLYDFEPIDDDEIPF